MRTSDFLNHHIDIEQQQNGRDDAPDDPPAVKAPKALRNFAALAKSFAMRNFQYSIGIRMRTQISPEIPNSAKPCCSQGVLAMSRPATRTMPKPPIRISTTPPSVKNDVCGDDKPLAERDDFRPARRRTFS